MDDMAERCDRLEAELLARESGAADVGGRNSVKDEAQTGAA